MEFFQETSDFQSLGTWDTMDRAEIESLSVWVKFPNLSLDMWTSEGLSLMESAIGKPLFTYRTTSEQSNLAYARVLLKYQVRLVFTMN